MLQSDRLATFVKLHLQMAECQRCPLHELRQQVVPGEGPWDADIMLIGEAPGATEDLVGRPFVGAAGGLLDRCLKTVRLNRKKIYITNVVKCRPFKNRQPTTEEKALCFHYLSKQLEIVDPRLVILSGATSLSMFWPKAKITVVHGTPFTSRGRIFLPIYHPAAALRDRRIEPEIVADLKKVKGLLSEGVPEGTREISNVIAFQSKLSNYS